jgi:transposase InsO family protein
VPGAGVSPSGYYAWRKRAPSRRERDNQQLLEKIRSIHAKSHKTYGSPRVHAQLRKQGFSCSRKRVAELMRRHEIQAEGPKRMRTTRGHGLPIAANALGQDFSAQRPNEVVSDLTAFPLEKAGCIGGDPGPVLPPDRRLGHGRADE